MIVAFCGHRNVHDTVAVHQWLDQVVKMLVKEGADEFWSGDKGDFSLFGIGAVTSLKWRYTHLRTVLVQAYIDQEADPLFFDEKLYPPLEDVPRRFAMQQRDRYMALNADVLVMYAVHNFGNSMAIKELAERKGKRVINYPDLP